MLNDVCTILVIADDPDAGLLGDQAAAMHGAHAVAHSTWRAAPGAIADAVRLVALFADAQGVDDAALAKQLGAISAATDARLVVIFAVDQIDAVAAAMLPTSTILLCDPSAGQRAAALASAVIDDGLAVRDTSRDVRRFQQLNEEVARFAETLARLAGLDAPEGSDLVQADAFVADPTSGYGAMPTDIDPAEIRRAIRARRLREDAFDQPGLFEDPAWDMLLDLFAAQLERRRVSVSSLCIAAAVAPTTALRWIGKLIEAGLLDRQPDDFDRRRAFISLSAQASAAMRNYVAIVRRAGLAIV